MYTESGQTLQKSSAASSFRTRFLQPSMFVWKLSSRFARCSAFFRARISKCFSKFYRNVAKVYRNSLLVNKFTEFLLHVGGILQNVYEYFAEFAEFRNSPNFVSAARSLSEFYEIHRDFTTIARIRRILRVTADVGRPTPDGRRWTVDARRPALICFLY